MVDQISHCGGGHARRRTRYAATDLPVDARSPSTMDPSALLAVRVAASLTAGTLMLALALVIVIVLIVRLPDVIPVPGTKR